MPIRILYDTNKCDIIYLIICLRPLSRIVIYKMEFIYGKKGLYITQSNNFRQKHDL